MNDLISVIIPIYNIKDCLPRCVESVCKQTYTNLEILLVDDGSTDGTGELCESLAKEDFRIQVFHKPNGGSSSARNLGLMHAKGDFVGFVDSDDWIDEEMYETLYKMITSTGMKMAQAGRQEEAEDGTILAPICIPPMQDEVIDSETFFRELLLHRGDCSFCTKLCKRELFEEKKFPEGVLNEDFYLMIHLLGGIQGIASSHKQMYHVYYRIGSNTRKKSKEEFPRVFADCVDNAEVAMELVQKKNPDLIPVALRFGIFQRLEYLLHIPIKQMQNNNSEYQAVIAFIRKNFFKGMGNQHLSLKNKCYLFLFAFAPKTIRRIHKRIRKL